MKDIQGILEAQFVHKADNSVCILVVPSENYTNKTNIKILKSVYDRFGYEVKISIKTVQFISRSSSGKLRTMISEK